MRISKRFADSLLMTARSSVGVFIVVGRLRLPSARLGDDSIARLHATAADVDAAWTGDQVLDLASVLRQKEQRGTTVVCCSATIGASDFLRGSSRRSTAVPACGAHAVYTV